MPPEPSDVRTSLSLPGTNGDAPDVPEDPLVPEDPDAPEDPLVPEDPDAPEEPLVPEEPDAPEEPLVPEDSVTNKNSLNLYRFFI